MKLWLFFLDAIISPQDYPDLIAEANWDRETITRALGLKASLCLFQTFAVFIITNNVLDEVKVLASKLQKHEQGIFEAHEMVSTVIHAIENTRSNVDVIFSSGTKKSWCWRNRLV